MTDRNESEKPVTTETAPEAPEPTREACRNCGQYKSCCAAKPAGRACCRHCDHSSPIASQPSPAPKPPRTVSDLLAIMGPNDRLVYDDAADGLVIESEEPSPAPEPTPQGIVSDEEMQRALDVPFTFDRGNCAPCRDAHLQVCVHNGARITPAPSPSPSGLTGKRALELAGQDATVRADQQEIALYLRAYASLSSTIRQLQRDNRDLSGHLQLALERRDAHAATIQQHEETIAKARRSTSAIIDAALEDTKRLSAQLADRDSTIESQAAQIEELKNSVGALVDSSRRTRLESVNRAINLRADVERLTGEMRIARKERDIWQTETERLCTHADELRTETKQEIARRRDAEAENERLMRERIEYERIAQSALDRLTAAESRIAELERERNIARSQRDGEIEKVRVIVARICSRVGDKIDSEEKLKWWIEQYAKPSMRPELLAQYTDALRTIEQLQNEHALFTANMDTTVKQLGARNADLLATIRWAIERLEMFRANRLGREGQVTICDAIIPRLKAVEGEVES